MCAGDLLLRYLYGDHSCPYASLLRVSGRRSPWWYVGRRRDDLCLSRELPAERTCRLIAYGRNAAELWAVPGILAIFPVFAVGHGRVDWDRCDHSDPARQAGRPAHPRNTDRGRNGRSRHQPTARLETAHPAVSRYRCWDHSRHCGCVDQPENRIEVRSTTQRHLSYTKTERRDRRGNTDR